MRKNPELGVSFRRKVLGLSHFEGSLCALMVGCTETFALYYAVRRGLNNHDLAIVSTVPILLGAIANWFIPRYSKSEQLKPMLLAMVFTQIIGLAGLVHSVNTPNHFPWIFASLSLYWIGGMASSPLWIDWMSGWLPQDWMARYLSRRNSFTALMTVIGYLIAAIWIYQREDLVAFQIIFALGLLCRSFSFLILFFQPNPSGVGVKIEKHEVSKVSKVFESKPIWIMILFVSLFRFVANIASPFFLPYMVDNLHFTLIDYAWITAVPFLARAVFLTQWGEAVRTFRPFIGLQIGMLLLGAVCALWTFTSHIALLSIFEAASGIAWGGIDLCGVLILYSFAPRKARGIVGFHLALTNFANVLGALLGSSLLESGMNSIGLFRFSSILRFFVAAAFILIGFQLTDVRAKLRVYGEFFTTAMSLRQSISTLVRFVPRVPLKRLVRKR